MTFLAEIHDTPAQIKVNGVRDDNFSPARQNEERREEQIKNRGADSNTNIDNSPRESSSANECNLKGIPNKEERKALENKK